jgi:hypothetical protein
MCHHDDMTSIALAVLFTSVLLAQSQPPSSTAATASHENQNQPAHARLIPAPISPPLPEKSMSVAERWLVWIAGFGALVNSVIAFLIFCQWRAMRRQIGLMQDALDLTRNDLALTKQAATESAKAIADAMEIMRNLVATLAESKDVAAKSAESLERLAGKEFIPGC